MNIPPYLYNWAKALRLPYFITSAIPPILALKLAAHSPVVAVSLKGIVWGQFFILLAGALCMHAATNLFNDYYDTINGVDNPNSVGGSRVVLDGRLTLTNLKWAGTGFYTVSFSLFLFLGAITGYWWALLGWTFGFAASFFYVGPPLAYGYRGFGELAVFVTMGWVLLLGSFLVLTGWFDWHAFWISPIFGLMSAGILFFQSLAQIETDPGCNKRTLASKLGRKRSALVQSLIWPLVWAACVALSMSGLLNWAVLINLFNIPLYLICRRRVLAWANEGPPERLYNSGYLVRGMFFITSLSLFLSIS